MTSAIRYIALDTESTGIGPKNHRLTEVAAVEFNAATGLPTGRNYHSFLNPGREVPEEAVKVHGMTWDMLKDKPAFPEIAPELLKFLAGSCVVIHNAPFDVGFLETELKRAKLTPLVEVVDEVVDTLALSRRYVRLTKKHTLDALCDRYQVDRTKRTLHGALVDCEMLAGVFPHLIVEVNKVREKIEAILPFKLGATPPDSIEECVERYLALDEILKLLKYEQNRYKEPIREMSQGKDIIRDTWGIEHSDRTLTNWDDLLKSLGKEGMDRSPFQKKGSEMKIFGV